MVLAKWHLLNEDPQNAESRLEEASVIFEVELCLLPNGQHYSKRCRFGINTSIINCWHFFRGANRCGHSSTHSRPQGSNTYHARMTLQPQVVSMNARAVVPTRIVS